MEEGVIDEEVEGGELSEAVVLHKTVDLVKKCISVPEDPFSDPPLKVANFGRLSQLQR